MLEDSHIIIFFKSSTEIEMTIAHWIQGVLTVKKVLKMILNEDQLIERIKIDILYV